MLVKSTIIGVKKMHLLIDDAYSEPLNLYMTLKDRPFYNPKQNKKNILYYSIRNDKNLLMVIHIINGSLEQYHPQSKTKIIFIIFFSIENNDFTILK